MANVNEGERERRWWLSVWDDGVARAVYNKPNDRPTRIVETVEVVPAKALREAREELERLRSENDWLHRQVEKPAPSATAESSSPEPEPQPDGSKRHWWVQSDDDDGQVIDSAEALEAVKRWAASGWSDVVDGMTIEAFDVSLVQKFVARQTNEIADDDMDTGPEFEFVPGASLASEPKLDGSGPRSELGRLARGLGLNMHEVPSPPGTAPWESER